MMDLSWTELLVIAVVAVIVIGPKELPLALKTVGQWVSKARALAREFQGSVEEMVREAELDELRKKMLKIESVNISKEIEDAFDPQGTIAKSMIPNDLAPALQEMMSLAPNPALSDVGDEPELLAPRAPPARVTAKESAPVPEPKAAMAPEPKAAMATMEPAPTVSPDPKPTEPRQPATATG